MSNVTAFDLCWLQSLSGGGGVLRSGIPATETLDALLKAQAEARDGEYGAGVVVYLRPAGDVLAAVASELEYARSKHAPLNSAHEAYAVILEELDEFKAEVWKKTRDRNREAMRAELIQLAAMAIRAIEDLEL